MVFKGGHLGSDVMICKLSSCAVGCFGFSLEQLCINFANESLQGLFNRKVGKVSTSSLQTPFPADNAGALFHIEGTKKSVRGAENFSSTELSDVLAG